MPEKTTEAARPPAAADARRTAELMEALKDGPRGALFLSSVAVGLLFVGWLAFYFFIFLRRGSIG